MAPMDSLAGWDRFLTERDKQHLAVWGKKAPFGFGTRPAVLVVDAHYRAVGLEREPLLESIKTWPMSSAHWMNLFDMDQKYADVIDLADALCYFERLP